LGWSIFGNFPANGQIASRKSTSGSNQTETIHTANLAPGFYISKVSCEGQKAQQKIVQQKQGTGEIIVQ